jgi:hypothetical protein
VNDEDQLTAFCSRLGAKPPQDRLMARKLLERAGQMARDRDMDELQALQHLLTLLVKAGGAGSVPDSAPQTGSGTMPEPENLPGARENR